MDDATKHKQKTCERLGIAITALHAKQKDVAKNCGISESTLSNWLNASHYPSHYFLYRFSEFYPITTDYLLSGSVRGIDGTLAAALKAAEAAS